MKKSPEKTLELIVLLSFVAGSLHSTAITSGVRWCASGIDLSFVNILIGIVVTMLPIIVSIVALLYSIDKSKILLTEIQEHPRDGGIRV